MNRDFKKENRGKKSKSYLLEPLINQKKAIMDHPQEVEEEVPDVEDSPKATKKKKRGNRLTSQRLCYNCQKIGHFVDKCYADKKKKGNEEKINVIEETEEESALMMVVFGEYGELLLQGASELYNDHL